MFAACADPKSIEGLTWAFCYLTSGKHLDFYQSFLTVLCCLPSLPPARWRLGLAGQQRRGRRSCRCAWWARPISRCVRGIPDIIFFLFFVIALDQGIEYLKNLAVCPAGSPWPWQGLEFKVCPEAKVPLGSSSAFWHNAYGFALAVVTFGIVFGAFTANVIFGAMQTVPKAQLETAEAYGMSHGQVFRRILVPQMWVYALPGLSNLWMILIKATPLLFLLGVEDIVYYARELGGSKTQQYAYPHGDWRLIYFIGLLFFYLTMTKLSEGVLGRLSARLSKGQATAAGEAMRRAGA